MFINRKYTWHIINIGWKPVSKTIGKYEIPQTLNVNINTLKRQSKSEKELSLSVLTCIRKIELLAVYELIFSKWFCCIKLDFCAFTSGLSQNQF